MPLSSEKAAIPAWGHRRTADTPVVQKTGDEVKSRDYRNLLLEKLRDIKQRHGAPEDIAIERNAEMMDEIQRTAERELTMTTLAMSWKTSVAIHASLGRLDDGTYGMCLACQEPINDRRLQAIPWAEQCIGCQQREESESPLAAAA